MDAEVYIQILPILTMILTLFIIRRYVSFEAIPGFDKLSGLIVIIASILCLMWILDRTQIYAFSYLPVYYVLIMLIGGILIVRYIFSRMITS